MSAKKMSGLDYFYVYVVPKVTSLGAAVVILGALFKIMHWPGASEMLIVGMSVEAFIFALGVGEPIHPDAPRPDWSKVYPQLAEGSNLPPLDVSNLTKPEIAQPQNKEVAAKIAALEAQLASTITPDKVKSLGDGMQALADNVAKMTSLANASVATEEYSKNVKLASNALVEMNKSYSVTISAMSEMANASKDAKAYHAQVQTLTKNLTELNAVYEVELRSASKHVKAMNDFYSSLAVAMQNVANASKDTETFKVQLSQLTTNLTSLNKVYGGMLAAMKA
ncbi:MAG: gliding motility protein GldL [Microscillaceae bacterium]|jgi:gliding motility-associated protein GldL|nr:gliding motility protein GldL [Microscillaceae bacterium]